MTAMLTAWWTASLPRVASWLTRRHEVWQIYRAPGTELTFGKSQDVVKEKTRAGYLTESVNEQEGKCFGSRRHVPHSTSSVTMYRRTQRLENVSLNSRLKTYFIQVHIIRPWTCDYPQHPHLNAFNMFSKGTEKRFISSLCNFNMSVQFH